MVTQEFCETNDLPLNWVFEQKEGEREEESKEEKKMGERKTGRKGGRKGESKNGNNNKQPELTCVWTDGFFFF